MSRTVTLPPATERDDRQKVGGWWHARDDGRVVCDLCPRGCALKEGDRGFCFVRQNLGGEMVLTTYGRSTGFCVDPVEKKPLNHFYPGSAALSFGTMGCNLACKFCQAWTFTRSREADLASEEASPGEIAEAARRLGCESVAFTYNDPVIWAEYAIDTARACRERGVRTIAKTAGYISPGVREAFFEVMDAANIDLKAFSESFYRHLSLAHLRPVLDTLRWVKEHTRVWLEITALLIPELNTSPEGLRDMCVWIRDTLGDEVPVHFTAFHPAFRMFDRPPTLPATLSAARRIAREVGLKYVYTGNVIDPEEQSTYCPACGGVVIGRTGYRITAFRLKAGHCAACGHRIAGHFRDAAGSWGPYRQPVDVRSAVAADGAPGGRDF